MLSVFVRLFSEHPGFAVEFEGRFVCNTVDS